MGLTSLGMQEATMVGFSNDSRSCSSCVDENVGGSCSLFPDKCLFHEPTKNDVTEQFRINLLFVC